MRESRSKIIRELLDRSHALHIYMRSFDCVAFRDAKSHFAQDDSIFLDVFGENVVGQ